MSKLDIVCGMNNVDAILESCSKTLALLADNIEPDDASVLFGVIQHIDTASNRLDEIQQVICEKAVIA